MRGDVLLPRGADGHAAYRRPLRVASGEHAERVHNRLRPPLIDLVEQRCEDAPRLDELGGGDEEALITARRVEEHALVPACMRSARRDQQCVRGCFGRGGDVKEASARTRRPRRRARTAWSTSCPSQRGGAPVLRGDANGNEWAVDGANRRHSLTLHGRPWLSSAIRRQSVAVQGTVRGNARRACSAVMPGSLAMVVM